MEDLLKVILFQLHFNIGSSFFIYNPKTILHYLQVEVNRLMELINSNDQYRTKFNELYEENKFLLDNPEELYERINNLTMTQDVVDSKKLIRELKEKKSY